MSLPEIHRRAEWTKDQQLPGHSKVGPWDGFIAHHFWRPDIAADVGKEREAAVMRSVDAVHAGNGWGGIGYAFVIFDSGRLWEGRGWSRTGAHTVGQNSKKAGVCFAINGDRHFPSPAAWATFAGIIMIGEGHGLVHHGRRIERHHDYAAKSCPGELVTAVELGFLRAWIDGVTAIDG